MSRSLRQIVSRKLGQAISYSTLALILLVTLFPIYWMFITSLKTPLEFMAISPTWLPMHITLEHYYAVIVERGFARFFANTAMVAAVSTVLSMVAGSLAGYSLTRFRFPAKLDDLFLVWTLVMRIVPPIVLVIPLFIIFRELGVANVKLMLILSYQIYTLPLCVWMLLGFFRDVPTDLEEAAMVDGASRIYALRTVVFPLVAPGLVAAAVFSLVTVWNEFTYALIFARVPDDFTVSIGMATFITEYKTLWGELSAGGLLSSLPILVFAAYVQKHLLRGFTLRGVLRR